MLCDNCQKRRVCRYSKQCELLEKNITDTHIEDVFTLKISCKEYLADTSNLVTRPYTVTYTNKGEI
jgi:hypothetical protein